MTLLSAEYRVKWLHGDLPLLSANCSFCNSHWHGGLAPALPGYSAPLPVLSLAYRPCLTDCQPLGSDSILSWYAVRECSKTAMLPGSDGYKIAGRQWKGKRGTKKNKKITTCLAERQVKKGDWARRGATSPYFVLLVLLLGVIDVIDQPKDKVKIYRGRRFSFSPKWRHQWRQPSSTHVV